MELCLRSSLASDATFAYQVLGATMRGYAVQTWGVWMEEGARAAMSDLASTGALQIIEAGGESVGVLHFEHCGSHMQLEELFLLPQHQRQGLGALVMKRCLAEADSLQLPVRLRVLRVNPAKSFYERLGFVVVEESPERFFMERR